MPSLQNKYSYFSYLFKVYFLAILYFALFRAIIVCCNFNALQEIKSNRLILIGEAFGIGFRFDTLVVCSLLLLPVVLGSIAYIFNCLRPPLMKVLHSMVLILFSIAYFICAVDIPFFNYFFKRLNDTILNWNNAGGFGFKMIVEEPKFYLFAFLYIIVVIVFCSQMKSIFKKTSTVAIENRKKWFVKIPLVLLLWSVLVLGIRGRIAEKSPIIAGAAFFSPFPFLNQLALNPVFTVTRSLLDRSKSENISLAWVDNNAAIQSMHNLLVGAQTPLDTAAPIRRLQLTEPKYAQYNIVLITMESMAAHRMKRYGNTEDLTPFLDSLANIGWSFDNTFSAGIHTFNGIYSTLFAHPALMKRHSLDQLYAPEMAGFSNVLATKGYHNIFFTTHDELFDNMSGFLLANKFHTIVGQKDYPIAEVKSTLGVPDEFMFRFAIPKLNKIAQDGKPFFANFMTGSNHGPNIIPTETGFVRRHQEPEIAVIEYADWSIRKFMTYAAQQSWYKKTIFVFVADHGVPLWNDPYDVPFTYHHIPFIIYTPSITGHFATKKLALQTDVFPTVMSLVSTSYTNNTFGIDLFKQQHKNIVFSSDDILACMNDSILYVYRSNNNSNKSSLYKYQNNDKTDYSSNYPLVADSMANSAFSWLQTSQWMIGTLRK